MQLQVSWTSLGLAAEIPNPSFVALIERQVLYTVNELTTQRVARMNAFPLIGERQLVEA